MKSMNYKNLSKFIIISVLIFSGCSDNSKEISSYSEPPVLIDSLILPVEGDTLRPVRIQYYYDTLFVSYNRASRIDLFTPKGEFIKTLDLKIPEPVYPASFQVDDSIIYVSDHTDGIIARFDRSGDYLSSFDLLPDSSTRLIPFAIKYFGGVLYVCDIGQKKILAISMVDSKGITGIGELILKIPKDSTDFIEFPSVVYITFEGRLITADAKKGNVEVYTCDGQHIYDFDSLGTPMPKIMTVQAVGVDHVTDPELTSLDTNSFDPSGIRHMGRFHIVDANNAKIHIFNPLGHYIGSYPKESYLKKPSGLAIDYKSKVIYIADPIADKIYLYKY